MANHLGMAKVRVIQALRDQGWSFRRIARELGIDRETVARHLRLTRGEPPPEGACSPPNPAKVITGSDEAAVAEPAKVITGEPASRSRCEPFRPIILSKLEQGLSAQRIWQDLREDGFADGYQSVQRFIRQLEASQSLPFRRMECAPGDEAQVDFGTGAPVVIPANEPLPMGVKTRRRKTHVFRIVLSHSRKGYSEVVYRQTAEQFIRCLENAFWHFGGVPRTLVIDNLKAAVTKADWFDPELTPKIQSFCQHYGTVVLPTKPRTPRHKGKTEKGIDYVQENALKGRAFGSLADENRHLLVWERTVADNGVAPLASQLLRAREAGVGFLVAPHLLPDISRAVLAAAKTMFVVGGLGDSWSIDIAARMLNLPPQAKTMIPRLGTGQALAREIGKGGAYTDAFLVDLDPPELVKDAVDEPARQKQMAPKRAGFPATPSKALADYPSIMTELHPGRATQAGSPPPPTGTHADRMEEPSELAGQVAAQLAPFLSRQAEHLAESTNQVLLQHQACLEERINAAADQVGGVVIDRVSGAAHDLQAALGGRLDPLGAGLQAVLEKGLADRWPSLARELNETCSTAARRATLRPTIEQLLALLDRMFAERSFLAAGYHREPHMAVELNCRRLFEQYDQALQSVIAELYMVLRTLDVQPINSSAGPLKPQHQRVVQVEKTSATPPPVMTQIGGYADQGLRPSWKWPISKERAVSWLIYAGICLVNVLFLIKGVGCGP